MSAFGIVVLDLSGGDAAYNFVDQERWDQILKVWKSAEEKSKSFKGGGWKDHFIETIGWLTCDENPEVDAPFGAPERRGKLLKTAYTQTYTVEMVDGVEGRLLGILTLP